MFDHIAELPTEVQEVIAAHQGSDQNYESCIELVNNLESLGWTCEYGLDGIPYGLRKQHPKQYNTMYGVGRAKYVVNFHNGTNTHNDGSPFFDIRIFRNKAKMQAFTKELDRGGYICK